MFNWHVDYCVWQMKYKAYDIAIWFNIQCAANSPLLKSRKVQKLLYYAEACVQSLLDRELLEEEFEAWAHGPVIPELFAEFKKYDREYMPPPENQELPLIEDEKTLELLLKVVKIFGNMSDSQLEIMSCGEDWAKARGYLSPEERCHVVIPKNEIKENFKKQFFI